MRARDYDVVCMGVDVPLLAWIGGVLLLIGLFFALAGRRPERRVRKARNAAAQIGADGAARHSDDA